MHVLNEVKIALADSHESSWQK